MSDGGAFRRSAYFTRNYDKAIKKHAAHKPSVFAMQKQTLFAA